MPRRVQLRRTKGWRLPAGTVVVARPSRWGNPWRVDPGGSTPYSVADRATAVARFREFVSGPYDRDQYPQTAPGTGARHRRRERRDGSITPVDADGPLAGGNMSSVTRRGECVHRSAGPWTPTVHRLLNHLRASGLSWVPRPIAFDRGTGQEILSFIPGRVPHDPMPEWAWDDAIVVDAAQHLLAFHDATATYRDAGARWQLPPHEPQQVICHNDFVPYNMVFDARNRLVGVIDWDTASPGPRVWDLAYLAYRVVPLSAPGNPDGVDNSMAERRRRLRMLCRAYGRDQTPEAVVAAAVHRLGELASFTAERAAGGVDKLAAHVPVYLEAIAWLIGAAEQLTAPAL